MEKRYKGLKKIIFFSVLIMLTAVLPLSPVNAAADQTPKQGIIQMLEEIKSWDSVKASAAIGGMLPTDYAATVFDMALAPTLAKLEYEIGNSKITGRNASVDLSVTAADIKLFAGDIAAQAIGAAAIRKITGIPLDIEAFVFDRVKKAMDNDNLTTIKTNTTAYLTLGGDGMWKLDMVNAGNLGFLEAITGGMVEFDGILSALSSGDIQS